MVSPPSASEASKAMKLGPTKAAKRRSGQKARSTKKVFSKMAPTARAALRKRLEAKDRFHKMIKSKNAENEAYTKGLAQIVRTKKKIASAQKNKNTARVTELTKTLEGHEKTVADIKAKRERRKANALKKAKRSIKNSIEAKLKRKPVKLTPAQQLKFIEWREIRGRVFLPKVQKATLKLVNIPAQVPRADIENHFKSFGELAQLYLPMAKKGPYYIGKGFVEYVEPLNAWKAEANTVHVIRSSDGSPPAKLRVTPFRGLSANQMRIYRQQERKRAYRAANYVKGKKYIHLPGARDTAVLKKKALELRAKKAAKQKTREEGERIRKAGEAKKEAEKAKKVAAAKANKKKAPAKKAPAPAKKKGAEKKVWKINKKKARKPKGPAQPPKQVLTRSQAVEKVRKLLHNYEECLPKKPQRSVAIKRRRQNKFSALPTIYDDRRVYKCGKKKDVIALVAKAQAVREGLRAKSKAKRHARKMKKQRATWTNPAPAAASS